LENSASNHLNETLESFAFFHIFNASYNSGYGIYNSTGELLKGNRFFEQYTELATKLDTKRSAFYLESKENEIIFGCSLSVKADNGREERVVFIQVYKNLPLQDKITSDIQLLRQFYERIKFEVENLHVKKYSLVGFWDEGDFRNIEETTIDNYFLEYTAGKIYTGKKTSVKISKLGSGFSLILKLVTILRHKFAFTLDVSQYPSESDVSVSFIKPNPDFEIRKNGTCQKITKQESWDFYKEIGQEVLKNKTSYSKGGQNRSESISSVVKIILRKQSDYCSPSNVILDEFDDKEKVKIFQGLIQKSNNINDQDVRKILIKIYRKIESSECKKDLHKRLFSRNIYIEELVEELVQTIYNTRSKDWFNLLFSNSTSSENIPLNYLDDEWVQNSRTGSKYKYFEKAVKKALESLNDSDSIDFLKYLASETPSAPKTEGRILLKVLDDNLRAVNFVSKLSEEEAKNLDGILGTKYIDGKKNEKKVKRHKDIKIALRASALVMIILASYLLIDYIYHPIGNEGENNSPGNIMENNSILNRLLESSGLNKLTELSGHKSEDVLEDNISSKDDQKSLKNNTARETLENTISDFRRLFSKRLS